MLRSSEPPALLACVISCRAPALPLPPKLLPSKGLLVGPSPRPSPRLVAIEHMNALSSQGAWLRAQKGWVQALVIACFLAGGCAMIVIGKWA